MIKQLKQMTNKKFIDMLFMSFYRQKFEVIGKYKWAASDVACILIENIYKHTLIDKVSIFKNI